jgi:hypothetical protein
LQNVCLVTLLSRAILSASTKAEEAAPMSETTVDQKETGFAFTDEDYTRRYLPEKSAAATDAASASAPQSAGQVTRLHGGGNSFMRARRRRLAASGSS